MRPISALGVCVAAFLATAGTARAGETPVAVDARMVEANGRTRLEFDLSRSVAATAFVLADPDRVVVELPEVNFHLDPAVGRPGGALKARPGAHARSGRLIESYRFGHFAAGRSRIVIDLGRPARIERAAAEPIGEGGLARLVVELSPESREGFRAAAARAAPRAERPAGQAAAASKGEAGKGEAGKGEAGKPLVVIDPGHGGVDTGASGVSGLVEKEVVFDFARDLARKLRATGQFRVAMTRETDVFVPLDERVTIARGAGAALLVSIHADSIKQAAGVAGATVYTVSDRASDAEAARVAESENSADRAARVDATEASGEVADILFDLTRRETRAFAHLYSRTLIGYLGKATKMNKNPARSAGFKVLKAPDVPSVLLELGYLSSEKDAQALASPEWRDRATTSVSQSISAFLARGGEREAGAEAAGAVATSAVAEGSQRR
ncbi:MAG: N-acetylmuramoyl-L-alanine amidase [Rhizobiales bacterium]|nr:N-acetylmuramoyl-L-alanine amidase [Hyphomicrobiales bacterium]